MLNLTIHPCRTAAERQTAHHVERLLSLHKRAVPLNIAHEQLTALFPELTRPESQRNMDLSFDDTDRGRQVTLWNFGRPYITIAEC